MSISDQEKERVKELTDEFTADFMGFPQKVGVVTNGDGRPVVLNMVSIAFNGTLDHAARFGCPPDDRTAILVGYAQAGEYLKQGEIPDQKDWVMFPRKFKGLNVYYHEFGVIRAL